MLNIGETLKNFDAHSLVLRLAKKICQKIQEMRKSFEARMVPVQMIKVLQEEQAELQKIGKQLAPDLQAQIEKLELEVIFVVIIFYERMLLQTQKAQAEILWYETSINSLQDFEALMLSVAKLIVSSGNAKKTKLENKIASDLTITQARNTIQNYIAIYTTTGRNRTRKRREQSRTICWFALCHQRRMRAKSKRSICTFGFPLCMERIFIDKWGCWYYFESRERYRKIENGYNSSINKIQCQLYIF
jgi:Zn-dependent oligopeptidase